MYAEGTDGRITLAWMESLGLDAAAPVVGYNVAGQNRASVPVGTPIATAEELAAIEKDGIYYLADDIVISGEWTSPVGFAGTLNGNGHGIVLDGATVTGGVFNQLDGALVRNLSITEGEKANTLAVKSNLFGVFADTAWGVYPGVYAPAADGRITLAWTVMNTLPGASVRLNEPTGLRFETEFDSSFVEALIAEYGADAVAVGTLIAPEAFVKEAGGFTREALDALQKQSATYLDVVAPQPYRQNVGSVTYVGSVADILEKHYTLNYAAIGYITVQGQTYYAPVYTARSVCEVASAALADLSENQNAEYANMVTIDGKTYYSPYTEAQRAVLQSFTAA